jgi:hypothetical protein
MANAIMVVYGGLMPPPETDGFFKNVLDLTKKEHAMCVQMCAALLTFSS